MTQNVTDEPGRDVFAKRYGEVLLVRMGQSGPEATVYNTYPLNDCPAELWDKSTPRGSPARTGRWRHCPTARVTFDEPGRQKTPLGPQIIRSFGGIDMIEQATVQLSSSNPQPYSVNKVDRRAIFVFDAGRPVFELVDPEGQRWVMQTWSQVVDKNLTLDDLPALGSRLETARRMALRNPNTDSATGGRHHRAGGARTAG